MKLSHTPPWTLSELAAVAERALSRDYAGPPNGRAREFPDLRTIRYYTTLGLLARPAGFRGRTALYGPLHLLQLVAIKRLQAQGRSLAEIQLQLVGLPESVLREIARLPADLEEKLQTATAGAQSDTEAGHAHSAFWSAPPSPAAVSSNVNNALVTPRQLLGISLAEGVTLLVEASHKLEDCDLEVIRTSAKPLLDLLQARRLLGTNHVPPATQEETS
jgi:DNA-binding transcriptional MerR regulator